MPQSLPEPGEDLLTAGKDAISIGIEDFGSEHRARRTAAIRNLYAGILLLCKHLLVQAAPKNAPLLLISAKTKFKRSDEGELHCVAEGRQTIDANMVIQRFKDLNLGIDISHLQKLQRLRNDLEHYFSRATDEEFENAFIEVQLLVSDLIARIDPSHSFGPEWTKIVQRSNAFQARRTASRADLLSVKWMSSTIADIIRSDDPYMACPECESSHIVRKDVAIVEQHNVELNCMQCATDIPLVEFLESMLSLRFGGDDYEAAKCSETYQVYDCPQCERATFVTQDDLCANCGATTNDYTCEQCNGPMPIWGVVDGNPYCDDDCARMAYLMAKND